MLGFKPKKQSYGEILNRYCVRDGYVHITDMDVYVKKETKIADGVYVDQEGSIKDTNHNLSQYIGRPEGQGEFKRISPLKDVSMFTKRKQFEPIFTGIMFTPDCIRGTDTFGVVWDDTDHGITEDFIVHIDAYKVLMRMNQYNLQYRTRGNKEDVNTWYEFYDGEYSLIGVSIKGNKIDLKELPFYKSNDYELSGCYNFSEAIKIGDKIKAKRVKFEKGVAYISSKTLDTKTDSDFPIDRHINYQYVKFFHNKFALYNTEGHSKIDLGDGRKILVRAIKP